MQCICISRFPPGRAESCGASMPHGFELECAGVVAGMVTVCNGSVVLRLEESDDSARSFNRSHPSTRGTSLSFSLFLPLISEISIKIFRSISISIPMSIYISM